FSSILPVPRATTFPSCGFSLAVSGMMIPPFFISCSSIGCTSTRSPSGLTLTVAIGCLVTPFGFVFGLSQQPLIRVINDRWQIVRLFFLVFVNDFELGIDNVAFAFTGAFFG